MQEKTLMELVFNPCGVFGWSPEGPVRQIHFPHLHVSAPGIFSDFLRSVHMPKREWDAESNRAYPSLVKLQPGFLSLQWKTCLGAELRPWFLSLQWKTCRILWWLWDAREDLSVTKLLEHPPFKAGVSSLRFGYSMWDSWWTNWSWDSPISHCLKFQSTAFSIIHYHLIHLCDGASDLVNRHPCLSHTLIEGLQVISFSTRQ